MTDIAHNQSKQTASKKIQDDASHCLKKGSSPSILRRALLPTWALSLWCLCILALAGLSQSCGRPHVRLSKEDLDRSYRAQYTATEANVSNWAPLWDKQSWIVALPEGESGDGQPGYLRSQLIDDISDHFSLVLNGDSLSQFRDMLGTDLLVDLSLSLGAINRANPFAERGPTDAFARVTFPPASRPWQRIVGAQILTDILPDAIVRKLALAQFRALSATSRFRWVEPNLGADPLQGTDTAPADSERNAPGGRPEEWFTDEAGKPGADPTKNRIRQVFTRINWHTAQDTFKTIKDQNPSLNLTKAEIPVAVVDTGVDYAHPDLKERMFKNPGEIEGNGIDDDRNGYIDDVYGIDATIPKGQIDRSFEPSGPADVGGPGKECSTPGEQGRAGGTCGHGTHVAGIVAAQSGGPFAVGLCDACRVYSVRASKKCLYPDTLYKGGTCVSPKNAPDPEQNQYIANGKIFDWDQIAGLNYLLDFVNPDNGQLRIFIINLSLGKYIYNRTMATVLSKLQESGVLIIAAAGNDNTETPMFPAGYASTLSVCATSEDAGTGTYGRRGKYAKADFSNFGDWVGICAPGVDIQSTFPGNTVRKETGTSMASPLVAGAAGYIWSILYSLGDPAKGTGENSFSIRGRLTRFADPTNLYSPDNAMNRYYGRAVDGINNYLLGTGLLDVNRALIGEVNGASSSYVANERNSDSSSQVTAGCIVSTIGKHGRHVQWKIVDILTTMPFLLIQFVGILFWRRRRRWQQG